MSKRAKGITIDKVVEMFNNSDIDEQLKMFEQIKGVVSENIAVAQADHDEKASKYQTILERINGEKQPNAKKD